MNEQTLEQMIARARMLAIMGDISAENEDGEVGVDHAECVELLGKLETMMDADAYEQLLFVVKCADMQHDGRGRIRTTTRGYGSINDMNEILKSYYDEANDSSRSTAVSLSRNYYSWWLVTLDGVKWYPYASCPAKFAQAVHFIQGKRSEVLV